MGALQDIEDHTLLIPSAVQWNRFEAQPGRIPRFSDLLAKRVVHIPSFGQDENVGVERKIFRDFKDLGTTTK